MTYRTPDQDVCDLSVHATLEAADYNITHVEEMA